MTQNEINYYGRLIAESAWKKTAQPKPVGPDVALVHVYVADDDDYGFATTPEPAAIDRKTAAVVAAHLAELISEGEAARILGVGRVEFREIEDALKHEGEALRDTLKPVGAISGA